LHYFTGDYQRIGATPTNGFLAQTTGTTLEQNRNDLWNGNIGMMLTHIANPDPTSNSDDDRWGMLGMAYRYDQLNRLVRVVGYNDYAYDPMLEGHAGQFGVPGSGTSGGMQKKHL
jgi:hypothetical protein